MTYRVYRSYGESDESNEKYELAAIEDGSNINDVTSRLIKAVCDDATGLEKYQKGYTAQAYAPEPVVEFRRGEINEYTMMVVLYPKYGESNDIIEYAIIEEP